MRNAEFGTGNGEGGMADDKCRVAGNDLRFEARSISRFSRDCSTVTGADLSLTRQESGESTWEPVNDSEWATNSANGSISSLIVWTDLQPPGNVATVSSFLCISVDSVVDL